MTQILTTASYVRNETALKRPDNQPVLRAILHEDHLCTSERSQKIWDLLRTPQTVKTLCRALNSDTPEESGRIELLLGRLYERDLIQTSPDS